MCVCVCQGGGVLTNVRVWGGGVVGIPFIVEAPGNAIWFLASVLVSLRLLCPFCGASWRSMFKFSLPNLQINGAGPYP